MRQEKETAEEIKESQLLGAARMEKLKIEQEEQDAAAAQEHSERKPTPFTLFHAAELRARTPHLPSLSSASAFPSEVFRCDSFVTHSRSRHLSLFSQFLFEAEAY